MYLIQIERHERSRLVLVSRFPCHQRQDFGPNQSHERTPSNLHDATDRVLALLALRPLIVRVIAY